MAQDWTEGYTAEVDYTIGFYKELVPLQIWYAGQLQAVQLPDPAKSFTYFEIGCGHGLSANVIAATNPQARIYANDFNPAHIRNARSLAEAARLSNIEFLEKSFAELLNEDLPDFDYITLHGVYSWISVENRQQIVEFIRRKLKPGGAVYVSYNSYPGWAAMAPIRRLLVERATRSGGLPLPQRMREAFDFVDRLKNANAAFLQAHPTIAGRLESSRKQDINYVAHEYFNKEWNILHFPDVAAEMGSAKLNWVGSCHPLEQFDRFMVNDDRMPLLNDQTDPIMREMVKDLIVNTQFRRDVYARGIAKLQPAFHIQTIAATRFALAQPRSAVQWNHKAPAGEVGLHEETYAPIVDQLIDGPKTTAQLAQALGRPDPEAMKQLNSSVATLVAFGVASPALSVEGEDKRRKACELLNAEIWMRSQAGDSLVFFASPVLGAAVVVDKVEQILLRIADGGQAVTPKAVLDALKSRGQFYVKDGKAIQDDAKALVEIEKKTTEFTGKLAWYRSIGVSTGPVKSR